jgi:hypothetical protein
MDKLITTNNGGIPYVNDDFRWSDESIRDYINSQLNDISASGLSTNGNFVISGVEITDTGAEYIITDGYMWIDGEVLKVDAGTYAYPAQEYRFEAVETFDPTGEKVTRAGATIDTYRKRRAVPINRNIASPVTDGQLRLLEAIGTNASILKNKIDKLLGDVSYTQQNYITNGEKITESIDALDIKIKSIADEIEPAWIPFTLATGDFSGMTVNSITLQQCKYKIIGKVCHLSIFLRLNTTTVAGGVIFTITKAIPAIDDILETTPLFPLINLKDGSTAHTVNRFSIATGAPATLNMRKADGTKWETDAVFDFNLSATYEVI